MVFYIILYLVFSISGLIFMKKGLIGVNLAGISGLIKSLLNWQFLVSHWQFVLGAVCYILSFLTWMFLLSKKSYLNLSFNCFYCLCGHYDFFSYFFHEQFNLFKIIGVVLIGLGILLLLK